MNNEPIPGATQFDGPIPGQSLTDEPGKMPWETPPEYTNVEKALDYILTTITKEEQLREVMVMLHNKVPVEALVRIILFTGFSQGKWTYDMMVLLGKPLTQLIVAIAKASDIEFEAAMPYHQKKKDWKNIVSRTLPMLDKEEDDEEESMMPKTSAPMTGLMSRPGVQ